MGEGDRSLPVAQPRRRAWIIAAAITAPALLCAAAWRLDPVRFAAEPGLLLLNVLPAWLAWLLLLAATRRVLWSAAVVLLLLAAVQAINARKLAELEIPLLPSDLAVLPQVLETSGLYLRYAAVSAWWLLLLPLAVLAYRWEPAWRAGRIARSAVAALSAATLASLALGHAPWVRLYENAVPPFEPWATMATVRTHGSVAYFVRAGWEEPWQLREADRTQLDAFWQRPEIASLPQAGTAPPPRPPDLIVWQSEAFFDPAIVAGLDDGWLPNLAMLRSGHRHGDLHVPTYGGLTSRTEFEVLTGAALTAFPGVQYPYQRLINGPMPALPHLLRQHGYRTLAVHPFDARFYRRNKVYPLLGFERFHADGEFRTRDRHGFFVSDTALTHRVRELAGAAGPQFVFAISMENHGPWTPDRPVSEEELARIAVPAQLDADAAHELRLYLHHLQRVDAALGELVQWARERPEPTLVLFYGDHLPALDAAFDTLGFDDGRPANTQPVPWVLFDNTGSAAPHTAESRHSYALASLLLEAADIRGDDHFRAMGLLGDPETIFDADERARLIAEFARDRVGQTTDRIQAVPATPAQFVRVESWGPQNVETEPGSERAPAMLWVRAAEPIARSTRLRLGGIDLDTRFENDRVVLASMPRDAGGRQVQAPGDAELTLFDPIDNRVQPVGTLRVRPRAERVRLASGQRATSLCAVEGWGPSETSLSQPVNPQTDGGEGFWVQAGCLPQRAEIEIGSQRYRAAVEGRLATISVPRDRLPGGERVQVVLVDAETSERLVLGETRVDL